MPIVLLEVFTPGCLFANQKQVLLGRTHASRPHALQGAIGSVGVEVRGVLPPPVDLLPATPEVEVVGWPEPVDP